MQIIVLASSLYPSSLYPSSLQSSNKALELWRSCEEVLICSMAAAAKGAVILLTVLVCLLIVYFAVNTGSLQASPRFSPMNEQSAGGEMFPWSVNSANTTKKPKETRPTPLKKPQQTPKPTTKAQDNGPTPSQGAAAPTASHPINPGCIARKAKTYTAVDMGIEYKHPSLIQYAKLTKNESDPTPSLSFMEYMALMSAYKFLKPERIMIHTYTNLTGEYWDLVQHWNTSFVVNKVQRVKKLGSKVVPAYRITHQADFVKVRGLYEFGGIISDFDVIIVNGTKLKEWQKKAECVLSLEEDLINAGFNSCIKNSTFVKKWVGGYYTDYRSTSWMYNASRRPQYILEDKKKGAVCYNMHVVGNIAFNPNWNHYQKWLKKNGVDWRHKVAAHYFSPVMKKYNATALNADNSFGEMLRYVRDA